MAVHFSDMSC